ncbi:zinc ribbon domain-containing protein [Longimicrobium sp.]|uniref:zinc ribbon domain-containing protein n=1 Tax=Longimicrobium sp. TaxID=2029185 RepID=UPI002CBFAFB4|nr:zinc ribbon domain-containing protein [Longimicrobium sp.]HSU17432.1 zinc ribbon domain-containing protein [Longimicrobium sp.]
MTLVLLSALLATVVGVLVVRPVVARRTAILADAAPGSLLDAEARRRSTLAALKDLEYDFLGGKLDQADYLAQRDRLSYEALAAIRAAEAAQAAAGVGVVDGIVVAGESITHACGFVNPPASRFCAGCGKRLR